MSARKADKALQYLETIFKIDELDKAEHPLDQANTKLQNEYHQRVRAVRGLSEYSHVELAKVFEFF